MRKPNQILVGTRKGAFLLSGDHSRKNWKVSEPLYLGHIIHHWVKDPKSDTMIIGAKTGHLGPTVFRSTDNGKTWKESSTPPAFKQPESSNNLQAPEGPKPRSVDSVFWLTPGRIGQEGLWYAGTTPAGLFVSKDDGDTWQSVDGFNENPMYASWTEGGGTPGGQILHSILLDPKDHNRMYFGISIGGVFESKDNGANWTPLNKGVEIVFSPVEDPEWGHDPHCVAQSQVNANILYHQNHCGIYRIERPSDRWIRIGENMPKEIGDIGFPIVIHPRDPNCIWVFPMDGTEVWPRTSPGGKPAVYNSVDGGKSWNRQDKGLPASDAYFTVKRQAMDCDSHEDIGIYFGTSQGEVWASIDNGSTWNCIVKHLPEIYSIKVG